MISRLHGWAVLHLPAVLLLLVLGSSCGGSSSAPTPADPPRAVVVVTAVDASGERSGVGGYAYPITIHLREQAGVGATMSAVELSFLRDGAAIGLLTLADAFIVTRRLEPNGTLSSRTIIAADENGGPFATAVQAVVTFTDDKSNTGTASGTGTIAPLPPAPITYRLFGTVLKDADNKALSGATVRVLTAPNANRQVSTGADGQYSLTGLIPGPLTVRFSAEGYESQQTSATLSKDLLLDVKLKRTK